MEMQIFELNRLTSRLTMTDTLENFTIEVKRFVTEKLCENYHSVEPYFYKLLPNKLTSHINFFQIRY